MKDIRLIQRLLAHLLAYSYKLSVSLYGWILIAIGSICAFFATEKYSFLCVIVAVIIDAGFGIGVSMKNGKFALSKLGRVTLFKISAYGAALVFCFMAEKLAHDSGFVTVKIAAGWALACEFWSTSASILILWPEATFFKIMRKQLRGEMEAKLGRPLDDILQDDIK